MSEEISDSRKPHKNRFGEAEERISEVEENSTEMSHTDGRKKKNYKYHDS